RSAVAADSPGAGHGGIVAHGAVHDPRHGARVAGDAAADGVAARAAVAPIQAAVADVIGNTAVSARTARGLVVADGAAGHPQLTVGAVDAAPVCGAAESAG